MYRLCQKALNHGETEKRKRNMQTGLAEKRVCKTESTFYFIEELLCPEHLKAENWTINDKEKCFRGTNAWKMFLDI